MFFPEDPAEITIVDDAMAILRLMSKEELGALKLTAEKELRLCPTCWKGDSKWCCYESNWNDD